MTRTRKKRSGDNTRTSHGSSKGQPRRGQSDAPTRRLHEMLGSLDAEAAKFTDEEIRLLRQAGEMRAFAKNRRRGDRAETAKRIWDVVKLLAKGAWEASEFIGTLGIAL